MLGTEVKAIKSGHIHLKSGWIDIEDSQAFLKDVQIAHYRFGNQLNHEEYRERRLLLKKREIGILQEYSEAKGMTLIPIRVYLKGSLIKIEIAVAKGKKDHDKRRSLKEKEDKKDIARSLRSDKY